MIIRSLALIAVVFSGALVLAGSPAPVDGATTSYRYGQTVDHVDGVAAAPGVEPGRLPVRAQGELRFGGNYSAPCTGCLPGKYLMFFQGQDVTISGEGYFDVNWEVGYGNNNGPGQLVMPRWTGLRGRLFHVASGGGHRMDDLRPDFSDGTTWMGQVGYHDTLPAGAQQMWQDEYYYLHGSVTLHDTENAIDYDLGVAPITAAGITAALSSTSGLFVRYGVVRDTGNDAAPVPQYVTRTSPTDYPGYGSVPQRSALELLPAPRSVRAVPSSRWVGLSWTRPAGRAHIDRYRLERSVDRRHWTNAVTTDSTRRTITGLRNGRTIYFRVTAITAAGPGRWSDVVRATPRSR